MKTYEELTFADDFMFCKVMENESICKKVIKTTLGVDVEKIEYLNKQEEKNIDYYAHGIRMDVYVKDSDRVFNLEMQNKFSEYLPLRTRYYQAINDLDFMDKKQVNENGRTIPTHVKYSKLKELYIVFFCKEDPATCGLPRYDMELTCLQDNKYSKDLNDKVHRIYYNTSKWQDCKDENVRAFLKYIYTNTADSDLTREIDEQVIKSKGNEAWRKHDMFFDEYLYNEHKEGFEEGKKVGFNDGSQQARLETAKNLLSKSIPIETVAECTGLTLEEVNNLVQTK